MNDHNLDDLIIDTPRHKGGKAKGFLTILALLIVVLIVAIVLTKIILKDPDTDRAVLIDNETEMISPELTLQNITEENSDDGKPLSAMIESEVAETEEAEAPKEPTETVREETLTIEKKQPKTVPHVPVPATPKPTPAKTEKDPATHTQKKEIVKIPKPVSKPTPMPIVKSKPKTKPAPAKSIHDTFYIQVGSFSKTPSSDSRLITAIRKQGYRYNIAMINGMHKVLIGPYRSRAEVDRAIVRVKDLINKSAFVVKK